MTRLNHWFGCSNYAAWDGEKKRDRVRERRRARKKKKEKRLKLEKEKEQEIWKKVIFVVQGSNQSGPTLVTQHNDHTNKAILHYHQGKLHRLDHVLVAQNIISLWNAELTGPQFVQSFVFLSQNDRDMMNYVGPVESLDATEIFLGWSLVVAHIGMKQLLVLMKGSKQCLPVEDHESLG